MPISGRTIDLEPTFKHGSILGCRSLKNKPKAAAPIAPGINQLASGLGWLIIALQVCAWPK